MEDHGQSAQYPEPNRRRHERYCCQGQAEGFLPLGGLLLRGGILNLSFSGCFIAAPTISLERGTHVEVCFVTRQMQFRVAGIIAVLRPRRGAGIVFQNLSPRAAQQLSDLIHELKDAAEPA